MNESVTVEQGGVSVTTNTGATEAELRTELETPSSPPSAPPSETSTETPVETPAAQAPRDDKGRFVPKTSESLPKTSEPAEPPAEPQTRRRDDTLPKHNPVTRMQQALAAKAEAERRAVLLEAELSRYRQGAPAQARPEPQAPAADEPQFEAFADQPDPYTAYLQAWTRWDRAQGIAQARAEWEAGLTARERVQAFQSRITADKTHYPDFDQVLTQADTLGLQVSAVMQEAIAESPNAADLVYYLATHPEECTQLAEESIQTPVAAATVMRRLLESRLAPRPVPTTTGTGTGARAPVSTAKPPVTPVGGSPVVSDDPPGDTASLAEHARYWNRRLRVPGS
jgi:hypothetical protein